MSGSARGSDDGLAESSRERALGVVGEDDGVDLCDQLGGALLQALRLGGGRSVAALDVQTQQLLRAADDAGLGDGGQRAGDDAYGVDASALEDCGEFSLLGVVAPEAGEEGLAAEASEVHGDVGRAAGALVARAWRMTGTGASGEMRSTSPWM